MTVVERIRPICAQRGIAVSRMERDLGFGNGTLNPKKTEDVSSTRLMMILQYLDISIDDIFAVDAEKGPAIQQDSGALTGEFKKIYNELSPTRRAEVDRQAQLLLLEQQSKEEVSDSQA